MRRDPVDFFEVRPAHAVIHGRLLNWARWCRGSRAGSDTHPMFRGYRDNYPIAAPSPEPIDTLDGHRVEKLVVALPEKHRASLQWHYVYGWISPTKMRAKLGLTYAGLYETVHDARTMLNNRSL